LQTPSGPRMRDRSPAPLLSSGMTPEPISDAGSERRDGGLGRCSRVTPEREERGRAWSPIGVVVEPGADDTRPELGLRAEAEGLVERLHIIRLKADVLARHLVE